MKIGIVCAVVALLSACGGRPPPLVATAECQTHGATFELEKPFNCDYFDKLTEDVAMAFVKNNIATPKEVATILNGRVIWIHDADSFICDNNKVSGCRHNYDDNDIELTREGGSLMHEMMHALDHLRGNGDRSGEHYMWGVRNATAFQPIIHEGAHDDLPGSWFNVADNSWMSWVTMYRTGWWPDWPLPITTPTPTQNP